MLKLLSFFIFIPLTCHALLIDDVNNLKKDCIEIKDALEDSTSNDIYLYYLEGKIKAYQDVINLSLNYSET